MAFHSFRSCQVERPDSTVIEYYIRLQNENFIEAILLDREPMVNGREGRKTVEIFTAVYRSMKEGGVVR